MRCSVFSCESDNQAKHFDHQTKFHILPKNNFIRQQWILACCRQDSYNLKTARICSKHFTDDDYEKNLMHELMNTAPKSGWKLKPEAVPHVNLPKCKKFTTMKAKKSVKKRHNAVLASIKSDETSILTSEEITVKQECDDTITNVEEITALRDTETESSSTIGLLSSVSIGSIKQDEDIDSIIQENMILKQKISQLEEKQSAIESLFTQRQLRKLLNPKARVLWSVKEVSQAITIHSAGPRAYRLLLKKGYPFPAVSTLKAYQYRHRKRRKS